MPTERGRSANDSATRARAALAVALLATGAMATGAGLATTAAAAPSLAPAQLRHAATELDLTGLTMNTWYTCVGPCASATYFSAEGIARSGVTTLGWSEAGTVTSVEKNGCLISTLYEALTAQSGPNSGDAIYFSTTKDLDCPTANANVYRETSPFTIAGGTGAFKSATGTGSFTLTVLNSPQIGFGTLTASVSY
ncbi:MAG TPA: hypothetical protein VEJ84_04695 [Acidimicrobiales bacterium]|nr:hypothetical protein [Acidimicrobiales bacterium]